MSDQILGKSISSAFRFLTEVLVDVEALMATLAQQMADAKLTARRSYSLRIVKQRIDRDYYALFAPGEPNKARRFRNAVMMHITLEGDGDEPLLLAVAVQFADPVSDRQVWQAWRASGSYNLMTHLLSQSAGVEIPQKLLKPRFAPDAVRGNGLVVRLCSLKDAADVRSKVVDIVTQEPAARRGT